MQSQVSPLSLTIPPVQNSLSNQAGTSFLEILGVLAVLTLLTSIAVQKSEHDMVATVAASVIADINRLQRASMRFYRLNNAWPADTNVLISSGLLTTGEEIDAWGNSYAISTVGKDLQVSINITDQRYRHLIQGKLPRSTLIGNTLSTLIDRPGEEASHDALYARDGSRALTGAMDANQNDINNVNYIRARRLIDADDNSFVVEPNLNSFLNSVYVKQLNLTNNINLGDTCITKSIGTSVDGVLASCVNGIWRAPGNSQLPIGSIYLSTNSANPATTLGYGTWQAFGQGRVLVGLDPNNVKFDTIEGTGGSETHTLTENEMPSHNHNIPKIHRNAPQHSLVRLNYTGDNTTVFSGSGTNYATSLMPNTGGSKPHNNLQPYIVVTMWKRVN